ncbi:hypothetical protein Dda_6042 [Drechslerella dactyloides]|uniref:DUF5672 domain-containing protein n=1 Tax=Drechslerella dactyloides TaxID=74499 RepID=A0AAD6IUW1_DREDA|nr:hypothetical protein Dda_6042 [Drechslerella dactyloides]
MGLLRARHSLSAVFTYVAFGTLFALLFFSPEDFLPGTVTFEIHGAWEEDIPAPSPYNDTKLALLIETRPQNHLTPLLLHFMSVIPPEWPFLFIGTDDSIEHINKSAAIRNHVTNGKLEMRLLPDNVTMKNQEDLSKVLTEAWFYEQLLPAEWLFVFQTDSMICANSGQSLNDWVDKEFTWVGASWGKDKKFGGNGGFSLRRISHMIRLLGSQNRYKGEALEDQWITERLYHMPGTKMANGTEELPFSVEVIPYPRPMGYHTGWGGGLLMPNVWKKKEQRDQILKYCPELKMFLSMLMEEHLEHGCMRDDI